MENINYEKIAYDLAEIANELWAREASNNCPNTSLRGVSWDELCNRVIILAAQLKSPKTMDLELCWQDSHYSYCDSVLDIIKDVLYLESLPYEEC